MVLQKSNNSFQKNIEKVRKLSAMVDKKLAKFEKDGQKTVNELTFEELNDLNQLLRISDYILCKYEDKKEVHSLLKDFVSIIDSSVNSMDTLNDDISELIISAENAINRVKVLQNDVSEKYAFDKDQNPTANQKSQQIQPQNSGNNLTKSSTHVYTQEYQQTSEIESEQVI